jgi:uncharacterized protein (TIGR02300 family)
MPNLTRFTAKTAASIKPACDVSHSRRICSKFAFDTCRFQRYGKRDFKHLSGKRNAVAKDKLGTKRACPETGRKFYDLNKDPVVSPYTGTSYPLSYFIETASTSKVKKEAAKPEEEAPKEVPAEEETEDEAEEEDPAVEIVSLEDADDDDDDDDEITTSDDVTDDDDDDVPDDIPDVELDEDDDDETSNDDIFLEDDDDDAPIAGVIPAKDDDEL